MKFFDSIVTICTSLLVLYIVASAAASFSSFAFIFWLQLLPSFDIVVWLLAAMFLVLVILLRSKQIIFLIAFFILTVQLLLRHTADSIQPQKTHANALIELKVMSLNVGQFSNDTAAVHRCIQIIRNAQPDVLCLQEFGLYYKWPDVASVAADFAQKIGFEYFDFTPKHGNIFGTAFFSKYEIAHIDTVFQLLSHTNEAKIYSLLINDRKLSVANVHLQSYNLFSSHNALTFYTLINAIESRKVQADLLLAAHPDVMVGDFNASPGTLVHKRLLSKYTDVQQHCGNSLIPTHQVFPTRLDYVFVKSELDCSAVYLDDQSPSDHKALIVDVLLY